MANTLRQDAAILSVPTCEAVIELLKAEGFPEHAGRRRRKRDPDPADGFRALTDADSGGVLVAWVPVGGGDHKRPGELAQSRAMAEQYADAAEAAGWRVRLGGEIWHHALILPPSDERGEST